MQKNWILLVVLSLLLALPTEMIAQGQRNNKDPKRKKKERTEKSNFWKEQVWYGGSMVLNYGGTRNFSRFIIGVTPMLGFKIKDTPFSVGPRIGYTYVSLKGVATDGNVHRVGLPIFTTAAFTRLKFLKTFFLHAEYELEWSKQAFLSGNYLALDSRTNKILTEKQQIDNFYVGGGYSPGGYEIMLLYNFNVPKNSLEQPFSIRAGMTFNF